MIGHFEALPFAMSEVSRMGCGGALSYDQKGMMSGLLLKMGDKGPLKAWRERFFIQKPEAPHRLYYFVTQASTASQGYINLEEGLFIKLDVCPA